MMFKKVLSASAASLFLAASLGVPMAFADEGNNIPEGQTGSGVTGTEVQVDLTDYGVASDTIDNFNVNVDINDPSLSGASKTQDDPTPLYAAAGVLAFGVVGSGVLVASRRRK